MKDDVYENILQAKGQGAFSKVEYAGHDVVLRTAVVKGIETSGAVRIYFDNHRAEVISGRRFDLLSGLWLLRPGSLYLIQTHIDVIAPLPEGVHMVITPTEESKDVIGIMNNVLYSDFSGESSGNISFVILAYRRIEMEEMTSIARLKFVDTGVISNRTNKSTKPKTSKPVEGSV